MGDIRCAHTADACTVYLGRMKQFQNSDTEIAVALTEVRGIGNRAHALAAVREAGVADTNFILRVLRALGKDDVCHLLHTFSNRFPGALPTLAEKPLQLHGGLQG